jgi:hypothetical protein
VRIARLLQPLIRRSEAYAARERLRTDGLAEIALDLVLLTLTRHGTEFDPTFTVIGEHLIPKPDAMRATLAVATHTMLATMLIRRALERGVMPVTVSAMPMKVPGTRVDAAVALPSRTLLVTIRELFAKNGTVVAALDRADVERRNRPVPTARGDFLISTPIIELALRHDVRIIFLAAALDEDWELTVTLAEPARRNTVEEILDEFAAFIDRHVHGQELSPPTGSASDPSSRANRTRSPRPRAASSAARENRRRSAR